MIMRPGSSAIIAAGLLRFVGFLLPSVTAPIFVWKVGIPFQPQPYQFTFTAAQPLAAVMVVVVSGLNYLGVRTVGRFQVILTSLKVATVIAILVLGLRARRLCRSPTGLRCIACSRCFSGLSDSPGASHGGLQRISVSGVGRR
jgi:hypothetical protein